jgi:ribosome-interacting GTPase 1
MPTNLPPDYFEIEKRFRQAETVEEKIEALQEMMSTVPKHKGTDHLRADLRRKLAKLKEEAQVHKGASKRDSAFRVPKAGAGQAVVIGPTNAGKSALVAALTGAEAEVSPIPNTTWEPLPGMMKVEDTEVQLVDTPPLSRDYVEPRLKELIRHSDLVLLVVDLEQDPIGQLQETAGLLEEYRIAPQQRMRRYENESPAFTFLPFLVLVNKCDDEADEELYTIFCELLEEKWPCLPVSAASGRNLERLRKATLEGLDVIRVHTKAPGKEPDHTRPFVMKKGSRLDELAGRIHKDFLERMKFARVWGKAVHDGQMVHRDYILQGGDVVEIHVG